MKVTINLTPAEVQGIKNYLKAFGDNPTPQNKDVQVEIQNMVSGYLHSPVAGAVNTYIAFADVELNGYKNKKPK